MSVRKTFSAKLRQKVHPVFFVSIFFFLFDQEIYFFVYFSHFFYNLYWFSKTFNSFMA